MIVYDLIMNSKDVLHESLDRKDVTVDVSVKNCTKARAQFEIYMLGSHVTLN